MPPMLCWNYNENSVCKAGGDSYSIYLASNVCKFILAKNINKFNDIKENSRSNVI